MKHSYIILINALVMAIFSFWQMKYGDSDSMLPPIILLLGVVVLTLNNTIAAGNKSASKLALLILLSSLVMSSALIYSYYEDTDYESTLRYSIVAVTNLIGIILLVKFIRKKKAVKL